MVPLVIELGSDHGRVYIAAQVRSRDGKCALDYWSE